MNRISKTRLNFVTDHHTQIKRDLELLEIKLD